MNAEKTLIRPDGSKIKISVSISIDSFNSYTNIFIYKCEKGKRKFISVCDSDSYSYRALSIDERRKNLLDQQLKIVNSEEINSVYRECLESIFNKIKI